MFARRTHTSELKPLTKEELRLFSDHLWNSPREMFAGTLLGAAVSVLVIAFWLAFTCLHLDVYWLLARGDVLYVHLLALILGGVGSAMLGGREGRLTVAFWAVCAVLCALFALVSGVFGLPDSGRGGYFLMYHVGPVGLYGVVVGFLYLLNEDPVGIWYLMGFLPVAVAGPLLLAFVGGWIVFGIVLVFWLIALGAYFIMFRSPADRSADARYRRRLAERAGRETQP